MRLVERVVFLVLVFAVQIAAQSTDRAVLPTGVRLDPIGAKIAAGNMPLAMVLSPEGTHLILSFGGWHEQGIQVIDLASQQVTQTIKQDGAFFRLTFSKDGRTLYVSGGNEDAVYRYDWNGKTVSLKARIELAKKEPNK